MVKTSSHNICILKGYYFYWFFKCNYIRSKVLSHEFIFIFLFCMWCTSCCWCARSRQWCLQLFEWFCTFVKITLIPIFCVTLRTAWQIKLEERWNRSDVSEYDSSIEIVNNGHRSPLWHSQCNIFSLLIKTYLNI